MTKKPSLLDPKFRCVNAAETNLHATFRRVRRELAEAAKKTPQPANVKPIKKEPKRA